MYLLASASASAPAACRLGGLDYGLAVGFGEFPGIGFGRNLVVVAVELDVGTVVAVDDGDTAVLELCYDFVGFLVFAFFDEGDAVLKRDGKRVGLLRERNVLVAVFEIRTEASLGADDRDALVLSDSARKLE